MCQKDEVEEKKKVRRNRYQNTIFIFIRKSFQAAATTETYHYSYVKEHLTVYWVLVYNIVSVNGKYFRFGRSLVDP